MNKYQKHYNFNDSWLHEENLYKDYTKEYNLISNKQILYNNKRKLNQLQIAILNSDYYNVEILLSYDFPITKDIIDFTINKNNNYVFNLICDKLKFDMNNLNDKLKLLKIKELVRYILNHDDLTDINFNYIKRINLK